MDVVIFVTLTGMVQAHHLQPHLPYSSLIHSPSLFTSPLRSLSEWQYDYQYSIGGVIIDMGPPPLMLSDIQAPSIANLESLSRVCYFLVARKEKAVL